MGETAAGVLFIASLITALAVAYRPVGDYLYRVLMPTRHSRVERGFYRLVGVNPDGEQTWGVYARGVLAFSAVSVLLLYGLQRLQNHLWLSLGFDAVSPDRTATRGRRPITNTNWQCSSRRRAMG